ncbi:hypothetical protein Acy02nite_74740 [Actinoplanes cyaneus]|uniref:Uncharacterized protein n=1 Tax=Actinoplanes cyaneus TaxID=52696 RepID=A0A919M9L8_9ACTN|nr:hypothetical protein Acy02nite_74740 [Actinoplanes cyaneus]
MIAACWPASDVFIAWRVVSWVRLRYIRVDQLVAIFGAAARAGAAGRPIAVPAVASAMIAAAADFFRVRCRVVTRRL